MVPPRPEDFPYTEQGRSEYYFAVEQAAQFGIAVQQQQLMAATAAAQGHMHQRTAQAAAARQAELEQTFLLLL